HHPVTTRQGSREAATLALPALLGPLAFAFGFAFAFAFFGFKPVCRHCSMRSAANLQNSILQGATLSGNREFLPVHALAAELVPRSLLANGHKRSVPLTMCLSTNLPIVGPAASEAGQCLAALMLTFDWCRSQQ
ncbi:unnamed protein product, partial [Cladocopium goreaui]